MKHRHLPYLTTRNGKPAKGRAISKAPEGSDLAHFVKAVEGEKRGKLAYPKEKIC